MRAPRTLPEQLLRQAEHLARLDRYKPSQANLRRAVSASYYAIFHHLSSECAKAVVGTRSAHGSVRHLVSRSFVHSDMADASKRFRAPAADLPSLVLVALA